jgi:hypothetical protein
MTAKYYAYTFTVSGGGRFPVDMLRYDSCAPLRQTDVTAAFVNKDERRSVDLIGFRSVGTRLEPTVGRWESFGWQVQTGSVQTVKS